MLTNTADERGSSGGIQLYFRLRSSNTSTADAADFAIKKTSAREVLFMVPVSRLTSLCFVAASSQGRRYPRLACSSWSNYRFGSSSCYINTIKKPPQGRFFLWCRLVDSNYRPTHYECVALPTELNRHCFVI